MNLFSCLATICSVSALAVFSTSALAGSSSCLIFLANNGNGATVQQSCDGAELSDLFTASGITTGLSKAIPMFIDKGYTLKSCTDSFSDGPNGTVGTAYSRCVFIKN
jgi:hypothetical protein